MARSYWIPPSQYIPAASAEWTLGRKSSGLPVLEGQFVGAGNTGSVLMIPIPVVVDSDGRNTLPDTIELYQFVSAASAGVTPLSSVGHRASLYEIDFTTPSKIYKGGAGVGASANLATLVNSRVSAGFIPTQQVSGAAVSPTTLSASYTGMWVSGLSTSAFVEVFTFPLARAYEGQESNKTRPYIPRLINSGYVLEIGAVVAISAIWEHYGALCKWN